MVLVLASIQRVLIYFRARTFVLSEYKRGAYSLQLMSHCIAHHTDTSNALL